MFGQGRSDHVNFIAAGVPSVFFSDATGPCYHTDSDDTAVVDYGKLDQQIGILQRTVYTLASTNASPTFVDRFAARDVLRRDRVATTPIDALQVDLATFPAADAANLVTYRSQLDQIVAAGPVAFDNTAMGQLLSISLATVGYFTHGPCDGFLAPLPAEPHSGRPRTPRLHWSPSSARSSMDRASDYGSEGWGFESLRAR